eukprot:3579580-Amphidinium_carterae.1
MENTSMSKLFFGFCSPRFCRSVQLVTEARVIESRLGDALGDNCKLVCLGMTEGLALVAVDPNQGGLSIWYSVHRTL